jgi:hypothetical protein
MWWQRENPLSLPEIKYLSSNPSSAALQTELNDAVDIINLDMNSALK